MYGRNLRPTPHKTGPLRSRQRAYWLSLEQRSVRANAYCYEDRTMVTITTTLMRKKGGISPQVYADSYASRETARLTRLFPTSKPLEHGTVYPAFY